MALLDDLSLDPSGRYASFRQADPQVLSIALASVFTDDVHLTFPMGEYQGTQGLSRFQEMARTTFERTHHIASNHDVRIAGDHAHVRAHLAAVHVPRRERPDVHFDIGGHYEADVVRTTAGWRIRRFVFDLVWTAGEAPGGKGGAHGGSADGLSE